MPRKSTRNMRVDSSNLLEKRLQGTLESIIARLERLKGEIKARDENSVDALGTSTKPPVP